MRKRGAHIKHRAAQPPGIVCISLDHRYETRLRMSVSAFRGGFAGKDHFLDLCDTHDLLALANSMATRPVAGVVEVCKAAEIAILNIHDRELRTGKWGVSGDESAALVLLADTAIRFWSAQSGELFRLAYRRMVQMRHEERARQQREKAA
jgi:hypothetical protein